MKPTGASCSVVRAVGGRKIPEQALFERPRPYRLPSSGGATPPDNYSRTGIVLPTEAAGKVADAAMNRTIEERRPRP